MQRRPYRGRFAPTPSGELHLGGARTALVAWLDARAHDGHYVVRVEDLDAARSVPGAEQRIMDELRWLGLTIDESPELGGSYGPYRQSEKRARFGEVIAQLLTEDRAYACFCSRKEIAGASVAPHGESDDGPRYPGTCAKLTRAQIAERARTRPPAIRLRAETGAIQWIDRVHGERSDDVASTIGDFVLRRADMVPAYQLAVVIDDAEMRISHVVRADDLLTSTARQILLYRALGWNTPSFAHVPLVVGPDGVRLSKRHGAIGIGALRARGLTPSSVVGALAATLGLCEPGVSVTPTELVGAFAMRRLPRTPTTLDPATFVSG